MARANPTPPHPTLTKPNQAQPNPNPTPKKPKPKQGGMKKEVAREVLKQWEGTGGDPKSLRKLFLRQSAVPALATTVQTLVDAAAAYSIATSAVFFV